MPKWLIALNLAALALVTSCAALTAAFVIEEALSDPQQRHDFFEETLDSLDIHSDYVDEFFALARSDHPSSLQRFMVNVAGAMEEPAVSALLTTALTGNPQGIVNLVGQTLDGSVGIPGAQEALSAVLGERAPALGSLFLGDATGVSGLLSGLWQTAAQDQTQAAALAGTLGGQAEELAAVLAAEPQSLLGVTEALLRQGLATQDGAVREMAGRLGLTTAPSAAP
jgi:hypothetical protein